MKKILKSLLVLSLVVGSLAGSTKAWFTSTVTASDNEIQTGTLLLAIDSTNSPDTYISPGTGMVIVQQNEDGSVVKYNNFPAWTVAAPGDTYSIYLAARNRGSLPFNYRSAAYGAWTSGARFGGIVGGVTCPATAASGDNTLVSVINVHRYAFGNCESEAGCQNIRGWLNSYGTWTERSGTSSYSSGPVTGWYQDGFASLWTLDSHEYVLYRVDLKLDENTDDCYQGATYQYDLVGEAKQSGGSW